MVLKGAITHPRVTPWWLGAEGRERPQVSLLVHLVPPSLSPVVPPHVPPCPLKLLYVSLPHPSLSPPLSPSVSPLLIPPCPPIPLPVPLSHPASPQSSSVPPHPLVSTPVSLPVPTVSLLVPTLSLPVPTTSLPVSPVHPSMQGGAGRDGGGTGGTGSPPRRPHHTLKFGAAPGVPTEAAEVAARRLVLPTAPSRSLPRCPRRGQPTRSRFPPQQPREKRWP